MTHRHIAVASSSIAAALLTLVALAAAGAISSPATPPPTEVAVRGALEHARASLFDHAALVETHGGSFGELLARLDADLSAMSQTGSSPAEIEVLSLNAQLDESLVDQSVRGAYLQPKDVRGAAALMIRASYDKSLQPLALYVPSSYDASRQAPLIIMLHGQGQTESNLLATPYLRTLADQTGAIFAAPFARGDRPDDSARASDVYDMLDLLQRAFNVDRRRVYLAGVSNGGFDIFLIAPQHPERWSALLAIAGTITNDDKQSVVRAMAGKRIFLVIGANDQRIKAEYVRGAAAYLLANGVESRYYEQPNGVHSLQSLQPAVEHAWRDMLSGVRNVAPDMYLPSPQPTASQRF